jgi:Tol biopolymer transport system component
MRALNAFAILMITSTLAVSQTLPAPQAVTDPKQIASKPNAQVEKNLSIEKLYMTRQVGAADWSPDGKQIVFVSNISGRNNLWLVASESGWPTQLTVSDQRQTSPAWSPDGSEIAFVTDRFTTSLDSLSYGDYQLALISASGGGQIRQLPTSPARSTSIRSGVPTDRTSTFSVTPTASRMSIACRSAMARSRRSRMCSPVSAASRR